jgi:GNAT superfamily N-acetyltransferase
MAGAIVFRLLVAKPVIRAATLDDVRELASLRALEWGEQTYWISRIESYLTGSSSPGQALRERICLVAIQESTLAGFIAGHLTKRHGCQGEVQWLNVRPEHRAQGIAGSLLRALAGWFAEHEAFRICVDVEPENLVARRFYFRHGAKPLNPHWLYWPDIRIVQDETARNPYVS